eukprot:scaffold61018_cov52-Cyclotella_meneghiniana.AAC.3
MLGKMLVYCVELLGENQYISTSGQKFTVRTKDKFAVDESDDEVKIVCAHCPEQWTVDDLNKINGHGIYLLGVHAYYCGEEYGSIFVDHPCSSHDHAV